MWPLRSCFRYGSRGGCRSAWRVRQGVPATAKRGQTGEDPEPSRARNWFVRRRVSPGGPANPVKPCCLQQNRARSACRRRGPHGRGSLFQACFFRQVRTMFGTTIDTTERGDASSGWCGAAQGGDRQAFGRADRTLPAGGVRHGVPLPGQRRGDAGGVPGDLPPRVAEDRAIAAAGELRRLAAVDAARMAINRAVRRRPLVSADEAVAAVCARQPTPLGEMLAGERRARCDAAWGGSAPWIARRWWPSTSTAAHCWR